MTTQELIETPEWNNMFWTEGAAIEFAKAYAKIQVETALKAASHILDVDNDGDYIQHPTKEGIINAYPLTNIE